MALYKLYLNNKKIKPGCAYKLVDMTSLESSPFDSFGESMELTTEILESKLQKELLDDKEKWKTISSVGKQRKKFAFAKNQVDVLKFLSIDPITSFKILSKTNFPEEQYFASFIQKLKIKKEFVHVYLHFNPISHDWNFDESFHYWSPGIMNQKDFSLFYGECFVKKLSFGGEALMELKFFTGDQNKKLSKSAIYKFLREKGLECNDEFFIDEFKLLPHEVNKEMSELLFEANIVFDNSGHFNGEENNKVVVYSGKGTMDLNKLLEKMDLFAENAMTNPKLINVYVQPYELGSVNFADLFQEVKEVELENVFDYVKLKSKIDNVIVNSKKYSVAQFKKSCETLKKIENVLDKVPLFLDNVKKGVYNKNHIENFKEFMRLNGVTKELFYTFDMLDKIHPLTKNKLIEPKFREENKEKNPFLRTKEVDLQVEEKEDVQLQLASDPDAYDTSDELLMFKREKMRRKIEEERRIDPDAEEEKRIEVKRIENAHQKIPVSVIEYCNKIQMLGELCKSILQSAGAKPGKGEAMPLHGVLPGDSDAQNRFEMPEMVVRVCKPTDALLLPGKDKYGPGIRCLIFRNDINMWTEHFDMHEIDERQIVQLIKVDKREYKMCRPLRKNWRHKAMVPRTASKGKDFVVFHPDIQPLEKAVAAIIRVYANIKIGLSADMQDTLERSLIDNLEQYMNDYNYIDTQFNTVAENLIGVLSDLDTPIAMSVKMCRVKECRNSLKEYLRPLGNDGQKKQKGTVANYITQLNDLEEKLSKEFETISKRLLDNSSYIIKNPDMVGEKVFDRAQDLAFYMLALNLRMQGFYNPTSQMPRLKVVRTYTMRKNIRAPILKIRMLFNDPPPAVKPLQPGKSLSKFELSFAESPDERAELCGFLMFNKPPVWEQDIVQALLMDFY